MGTRRAVVRYLHQHQTSGRLVFRRAIPARLRPFVAGKTREIIRSLKAKNLSEPGAMDEGSCQEQDELAEELERRGLDV
jgi:hypothetical protein